MGNGAMKDLRKLFNEQVDAEGSGKKELVDLVKVYRVDGADVRKGNIKFALGGHSYVYQDIPENEIWVEDLASDKMDFVMNATHELIERFLQKTLGYEYDQAHSIATVAEKKIRDKIKSMGK